MMISETKLRHACEKETAIPACFIMGQSEQGWESSLKCTSPNVFLQDGVQQQLYSSQVYLCIGIARQVEDNTHPKAWIKIKQNKIKNNFESRRRRIAMELMETFFSNSRKCKL